jgi:hypothetical protein
MRPVLVKGAAQALLAADCWRDVQMSLRRETRRPCY